MKLVYYIRNISLIFLLFFPIHLSAQTLVDIKLNSDFDLNRMPVSAPEKWQGLLGEYILNGKIILIREINGQLHAIDDLNDQEVELPLIETAQNSFIFQRNSLSQKLTIEQDDRGQGEALQIGDEIFLRNRIEPRNGETYKVSLDKTIEEYTRSALNEKVPVEDGDFVASDLVDVTEYIDHVKLDVRYATSNNFLGVPTYSQAKTFLQRPAVKAIQKANKKLNDLGYGLLMHDGYRPWYVTKIFWDATTGFERDFVADPSKGSRHNRGCAIDLTLYELKSGEVVKMVGTYDEMSMRSYPDYKGGTSLERWHRDLLRSVMEDVGFRVNRLEWWHFDYKDWQKYPILNETFEELSLAN
ncbi:MAG: M15 family metallopeptidase [Kordiimonadaceae bacterium]|nr:M15 family metallopeptidase [Kordiimonadaceae bacterium]MBT6031357.1 M15 family metallopeptidase [Kordiimonadaceae bacterium]